MLSLPPPRLSASVRSLLALLDVLDHAALLVARARRAVASRLAGAPGGSVELHWERRRVEHLSGEYALVTLPLGGGTPASRARLIWEIERPHRGVTADRHLIVANRQEVELRDEITLGMPRDLVHSATTEAFLQSCVLKANAMGASRVRGRRRARVERLTLR